jgi:hypothetical protein
MNVAYSGLFAAALIALVLTITSVFFLGKRGPWGSIWTFFLVLFLTLWTVSIYVAPIGPVYWGVAWIPVVLAGIIVTALLIAAMPHNEKGYNEREVDVAGVRNEPDRSSTHGAGKFFWVLIILFVAAIIIGMVNPQKAL